MMLGVGDRTLTLPVPVRSTASARSHENPSLQVCDLVAGIIGRYRREEPEGVMRDFGCGFVGTWSDLNLPG